jgi:hypothetical protein
MQTPEYIDRMFNSGQQGSPKFYAIVNGELQVAPVPNGTLTAELDYWAQVPALSSSNQTNWALTAAPEIYLFGALTEAAFYLGGELLKMLPLWQKRYDTAIKELQDMDDRGKWSGSTIVSRVPGIIFSDNRSGVRN